jgi:hypothetical protein
MKPPIFDELESAHHLGSGAALGELPTQRDAHRCEALMEVEVSGIRHGFPFILFHWRELRPHQRGAFLVGVFPGHALSILAKRSAGM